MTPHLNSPLRRALLTWSLRLAAVSGGWATILFVTGGFDTTVLGLPLTTHDPFRPMLVAAVMLSVYLLAGGNVWLPERAGDRIMAVVRRLDERWIVGALGIAVLSIGVTSGAFVAGGSDSHGYVSEVDLWLRGQPVVEQPWSAEVPWPDGVASFAPLGYRALDGRAAIVPTYPAGLPLVMAAAKLVAGHSAIFWVTPVSAGILVVFTWALGRRLGSSRLGAIAAWLVATSPIFLFMGGTPVTDVPVAAAWTVALFFLLGRGAGSALTAGLIAGLASLIRPNLAPMASLFGLWYLVGAWRDGANLRGARLRQFACVVAGLLPAAVAMAAINQALYGSPFQSGYGDASGYFSRDAALPNMRNYLIWFVETQTPLAALGLVALCLPIRSIWRAVPDRAFIVIAALFVAGIWLQYCFFLVFDAWWYLRFLLACWPLIMIGTAAMLGPLLRSRQSIVAVAALVVVVAVGLRNVDRARSGGAFQGRTGEHKYVTAGQLAGAETPENSVVLAMQHSGSIRYYGGRVTLRYDYLRPERIDADLAWLAGHGAHPYALLEDWEATSMRERFAGTETAARLARPPMLIYQGPSKVLLYDLRPEREAILPPRVVVETYQNARCPPPAPLPRLAFR